MCQPNSIEGTQHMNYYAGPRDQEAHTALGVPNLSRMDSGMPALAPCWTLGCRCLVPY